MTSSDILIKDGQVVMGDMCKISGIIFEHGNDDLGIWEEFCLTEEEEKAICEILMRHDTEGWSVRGTRNEIAEEIRG